MPTPPAPRRLHEHPMPDRAAGALLGPLVAAALVGVPPRQAAHLATTITTPPPTPDPDHLAHLLRFALHQGHTPHHPPTAPIARTWAQALHTLVHTRTPPTTAPELEHTPTTDPHSASWQALTHTPYPPHEPAHGSFACTHLTRAIHAAHRAGGHQAALYTGALTGARWGASALPLQALRRVSEHTDPHTLTRTALDLITPTPDPHAWPHTPLRSEDGLNPPTFAVAHPLDPHVLLGNLAYLRSRPDHVDAVVSLCRTHPHDAPTWPAPTGSGYGCTTPPTPTPTCTSPWTRPPTPWPPCAPRANASWCTAGPEPPEPPRWPPATPSPPWTPHPYRPWPP